MKKKDAVLRLWRECFDDSDQYVEMYFSEVYRDDDAMLLEIDGRPVSSLMLQRYAMNFHGVTVSVSYIAGAATTRQCRDKGYMSTLMKEALKKSYDRGDMLCTLIPANEWLYTYYRRHFGFSPVFYINLERYTSAHTFSTDGSSYSLITDLSSPEVKEFFTSMMERRPCCIQHSVQQYDAIVMDNSADGGAIVAIADACGNPAAMTFTVPADGEATVKDVLAVDGEARLAVLEEVHRMFCDMPVTVYGYYGSPTGELKPRGMGRIVNVERCLDIIAEKYQEMSLVMKIHDDIIESNNGTYRIAGGKCSIADGKGITPDYDIDIEVLTSIIFGNDVTRHLLDFPAVRPFMSLMLD